MDSGMRIQTALPSPVIPTRTQPATQPRLQLVRQPVDSFQTAKAAVDRSAAAAMAKLERLPGSVSGEELRKAILEGISDLDSHGASSEWSTIKDWCTRHASSLDPQATKVLGVYEKIATAARRQGATGLTTAQMAELKTQMLAAAKPAQPPPPPPRENHLAYALKHPNEFFKRQAYSAKYNPHPDKLLNGKLVFAYRNGNCGPTSLAMAVKAFGLEEKRASKNPEDSIDLARNAMTLPIDKRHPTAWDTLKEPASNDVGTFQFQTERGAQRLGLKTHKTAVDNRHPLKALDAAFAKGHMVLLGGQPGQPGKGYTAYEQAMRARSGDTTYSFDQGHAILVMGKDSAGRYLVADPLSRNGVVHLTAKEMSSFEQWHGDEVWR